MANSRIIPDVQRRLVYKDAAFQNIKDVRWPLLKGIPYPAKEHDQVNILRIK